MTRQGSPAHPAPPATARAAHRHAVLVASLAWLVAVVGLLALIPTLVLLASGTHELPIPAGTLQLITGLLFLGVHAVGEVTWPRPSGTVRRAPLVRRTVADVSPGLLRTVLRLWAGLLGAAAIALMIVLALEPTNAADPSTGAATATWLDALPLLVCGAALLAATEGVLRLVTARPTVSDSDPSWDLALRQLSAHRVLRGGQLATGWLASTTTGALGGGVGNVGRALDIGALTATGTGLAALGIVVGIAAVGLVAVPARPPRLSQPPEATPVRAEP